MALVRLHHHRAAGGEGGCGVAAGHREGEREVARREVQYDADRAAHPPDVTVFANVLAVGEGMRVFGEDYLPGLDRAIRSSTRTLTVHGPGARPEARIGDPDFFVELRVPGSFEAAGP